MLSVGILVGICILFLEYAVFRWVVPFCRSQPSSSRWKGTNVLFLSQVSFICVSTNCSQLSIFLSKEKLLA